MNVSSVLVHSFILNWHRISTIASKDLQALFNWHHSITPTRPLLRFCQKPGCNFSWRDLFVQATAAQQRVALSSSFFACVSCWAYLHPSNTANQLCKISQVFHWWSLMTACAAQVLPAGFPVCMHLCIFESGVPSPCFIVPEFCLVPITLHCVLLGPACHYLIQPWVVSLPCS